MTSLCNLKIGTRMALGFAAVLLFLAFIMGLGLHSMSSIQAHLNGIVSSNNVKVATANRMLDSAASQEQTSGIEQINQAITQMDQVTQQNAALVEEAAAAAASLQEQAGVLVQAVSVFRLQAA